MGKSSAAPDWTLEYGEGDEPAPRITLTDNDGSPILIGGFSFELQLRLGTSGADLLTIAGVIESDGSGETEAIVTFPFIAGQLVAGEHNGRIVQIDLSAKPLTIIHHIRILVNPAP